MTNLTAENLSKHYGEKALFENIGFTIQDDDKIGLIGINGTGKSALLRILANQETSETGQITRAKGLRTTFLSQNPIYNGTSTVLEQVFQDNSEDMQLIRAYEKAIEEINHTPEDSNLQVLLTKLTLQMKAKNLWDIESQVKTILTKLGILDLNAPMETLSGGQKKRVALACALITPCDLLILDEPTNHMDNDTIDWLEKFLSGRRGALLMVTHDRYFLDRVVNRTFELSDAKLYIYTGNYSEFLEKKLERETLASSMERKRQNLYRRELAWIRRGAKARTTKQKARIQRFDEIENTSYEIETQKIQQCTGFSRLGQKIIELQQISKGYPQLNLIQDFSYIFLREDRIGIIGDNGIGKSTLLNIICGNIPQDSGIIEIGPTVKIGYFSQESAEMDSSLRAIEFIKNIAEYITTTDGIKISASQLMENFLFTGEMQWTPISRLSGGERRRLYLLSILVAEPNVLILDEPTNDLDIDTLKVLENYIDEFNGTVVSVSHDRYFLDRVCNKIFSFEGNSVITFHTGNYSDYLEYRLEMASENANKVEVTKKATLPTIVTEKKKKLTYGERLELEKMDEEISKLEHSLADLEDSLKQYTTDFVKLQELMEQKEALEDALLMKLERQETLSLLEK